MNARSERIDAREIHNAVRGERFLDLVAALGGKFRRRTGARTLRMPCFLHGGSDPNLAITPETGLWHCHSTCGGGDAIEMVERARGLDFQAALAWLGEWTGGAGVRLALPVQPPRTRAKPPSTEPLMSELWQLVQDASLGPTALAWLAARRIDPDAALALGCRDFSGRRREIGNLLRGTRPEVLEAAGFGREIGWRPLAALLSRTPDLAWHGLAVPAWDLDAAHPARWRWRLFSPPAGEPKSRSPIGGGADLLGFGRPEHLPGPPFRVANPGEADTLLIVEGEPDWLSCVEACAGRAVVVSVCGGHSTWRDTWPAFGDLTDLGIRRVVVAVHHGKIMAPCATCARSIPAASERCRFCATAQPPGRDGVGHGETFAADVAEHAREAGMSCRRRLPAESYDLNDRHRRGELAAWLEETLV